MPSTPDNGSGTDTSTEEGSARSTESFAAEFARKTEKLQSENQALSNKLDQLTSMLQQQQQRPPPQQQAAGIDYMSMSEEQLEELSYNNPKSYARAVEIRATTKASALIDRRINEQQQTGMVMSQLIAEYPELGDTNSELSLKAVSMYAQLPNHIKNDPAAYKMAVRDAAADLGLLTKSKRKGSADDGDFALGSNTGKGQPRGPKKSEAVDDKTLEMAERLRLNIRDPKVVARLKTRTERKNWGKFE